MQQKEPCYLKGFYTNISIITLTLFKCGAFESGFSLIGEIVIFLQ